MSKAEEFRRRLRAGPASSPMIGEVLAALEAAERQLCALKIEVESRGVLEEQFAANVRMKNKHAELRRLAEAVTPMAWPDTQREEAIRALRAWLEAK